MINFSTLQSLSVPEGVVTQIAKDEVVLWAVQSGSKIILEVEKITSDTYAGGTTYTGEEFVLLDIYPETNGTVKVTYGDLTKTITDTSGVTKPNAQQVFFGTFNGISDSVETPASGTLVIEGDYAAFGCGTYSTYKITEGTGYYSGITAVTEFNDADYIPDYAFYQNKSLELLKLPKGITSIGDNAFYHCSNISFTEIPEGVETIGANSFYMPSSLDYYSPVTSLSAMTFPSTLKSIGDYAFAYENRQSGSSAHTGYLGPIKILATTPPTLGADVFGDSGTGSITVPVGCGETYKAAEGWSGYANKIVEASE